MAEITYQNALSRAAALCSRSEKCITDIRKKLFDWKLNPADHDKMISYLVSEKYIDEERFTRFYVRDKFRFNQWGKVKIRYQLYGKGIPELIINTTLEEEINPEDYQQLAYDLAKTKLKYIKAENEFERKGKLMRFLSGKGFEPDLINQIADKLL
ncbi:regulatory protein RecX [Saccharicrinis sp. FJH62]|uniref:regulatory protein RecX n=1 Tax=Saccharicrinis sp. FJH62 TaxID=3344657 RepID=UPI0035D4D9B2